MYQNGIKKSNKDSEQYIWRTVQDDKVRSSHAARAGETFFWTNPPEGGHPGEDFGCRCWAEIINAEATGLKQEILSSINDSSNKWTTFDFTYHFAFGKGRAVTLSEIGYLKDVVAISREKIFQNLKNQVANKMRQIKSGPLIYRTEKSYQFSSAHWVLGKGVVQTQTVGRVEKNGNILTLDAEVTYKYSDEITDIIDVREILTGTSKLEDIPFDASKPWWNLKNIGGGVLWTLSDFGGSPYSVTGNWKTKITGSILLNKE